MSEQALRIAIDGRPALWPRTDIGMIADHVLCNIPHRDPGNQYFAYFDQNPSQASRTFPGLACIGGGPRQRFLWSNLWLPGQLKRDNIDVFVTFLDHDVPLIRTRARVVSMVQDLIPMRIPDQSFPTPIHRLYNHVLMRAAARRSDQILTTSEFSRRDILQMLRVDGSKVHRTSLGVKMEPQTAPQTIAKVLRRYGLEQPFALAMGSNHPRRNYSRILEAFNLLAAKHPHLSLVILGGDRRGRRFGAEFAGKQVVVLGDVAQDVQNALMDSAELMVAPSLLEGSGNAVLEAMAHGLPVVTSDRGSLSEIAGDAALYADPENAADIAASMDLILSDSDSAERLRQKGRARARTFRWEFTSDDIANVCQSLIRGVESSLPQVA